MRKILLTCLVLFWGALLMNAQPRIQTQFTHYTVDDGLSENNALCLLQDHKGNIWFGTFDGLNKFDGYTFKVYKGNQNNLFPLLNRRIDKMQEDSYGNIWVQTYDGRIYRFEPTTERFLPVPQYKPEFSGYNGILRNFSILSDGSVWLYGSKAGDHCFRIVNAKEDRDIKIRKFEAKDNQLSSCLINKVYLDTKKNTWLLTGNGITVFDKSAQGSKQYFKEKTGSGFYALCETRNNLYIGGERGRLILYDNSKKKFERIVTPFQTKIIDIRQVKADELFILTDSSGFYLYNTKSRNFTPFTVSGGCGLLSDNFSACYMDKYRNIWLNSDHPGVVYFETDKRKVNNFVLKTDWLSQSTSSFNFFVLEDKKGNIWVHPRSGGFSFYNRGLNRLEYFHNDPKSKDRKYSNNVRAAISDRQGNIWICPYTYGIEKVVFRNTPFSFYKPVPELSFSEHNQVRALYQDKDNCLWVAAKNGLLYLYDAHRNRIGQVSENGRIDNGDPFVAFVYHIFSDHTGAIWLATKGKGLIKVVKQGRGKNTVLSMTHYRYSPDDSYSLSSDAVYSVFEDHANRLWIGTFGGGINLMETDKSGKVRFLNYRNKFKNYPMTDFHQIRFVTEDQKGQICVGTTGGLVAFKPNATDWANQWFYSYCHNSKDKTSLGWNDVFSILAPGNGDLYIGGGASGLYIVKGGLHLGGRIEFKHFAENNSLFPGSVFTMQKDAKGNVWMSAINKLVRLNPKTEQFDVYNPITDRSYTYMEGAVFKTGQGNFIYGTTEGFFEFNSQNVKKSQYVPRIAFTQLQILNKTMEVGGEGSPLTKILDDLSEVELTHKQNIVSIGFAALDHTDPHNIQYAYKMEGLDKDWNYVGTRREANYANLPKGKYIFRVRSTNADGEWVNNERSIVIEKLPSFWESVWGLIFYFILFVVISLLVSYILFTYYRLKNEVEVEHRITNMKLRFFTDISHELRTPLTLIASPLDNVLRNERLSDKVKEQLMVMQRNTDRMLRLINQILDFRKIQSNKMKLLVEDIHVGRYLKEICLGFRKLAEDKKIDLNIVDETDNAHLWVDKDKFEKIFYNLLSNAFKFSLPGSPIGVTVEEDADSVMITVTDKGVGIGKEMIKQLFNRFESLVTDSSSLQSSTGIGLSLTKELVELHKGKIDVESESGKGAAFKVTFLKGKEHFTAGEEYIIQDMEKSPANIDSSIEIEQEAVEAMAADTTEQEPILSELPTLLVVEDNRELRDFLTSVLRHRYVVFEAENGEKALEILPEISPDLIISDIMMPEMNGLELSKAIKEDINLSHIPLVLLTAKNDIDSKLEALEYGVDDYITKPFSSAYLEARIENLLKLRKQLQEFYRSSLTSGVISLAKPKVNSQDDLFIQRIMAYIEENMEDSDLSIDGIASHMGLGRSTMFKKLKSLTGLAPVDFIKEIRIQRAAQYIETGEFNVSEVAYKVGMIYPRYFSKCFKDKFGITPSEYKEKCQQNKS